MEYNVIASGEKVFTGSFDECEKYAINNYSNGYFFGGIEIEPAKFNLKRERERALELFTFSDDELKRFAQSLDFGE